MFSGNAKTHFQVLGRSENSTGYMMSPFGDDRWDLDDSEKLKKIFKNGSPKNSEAKPSYNLQSTTYPRPQLKHSPNANYGPSYQPVKPPHYGYIHQSETARGYIPKTEVVQMTQPPPVQAQPQQCVYPNPLKETSHYQEVEPMQRVPVETVHEVYQNHPGLPTYRPFPSTKHYNGLNQDEIRHRSRVMRPVQSNFQEHVTQSLPQIANPCGRCHCTQPTLGSSNMSQNHWKTSPDVPLWIAGRTGYQPFGPSEATPNPFFPPQQMTDYIPLK